MVTMITWNFHCVPVPPFGCPVGHLERVAEYAAALVREHDPDVLVLNEAFVALARDTILESLRRVESSWRATPSDCKGRAQVGSGVVVAWRGDRFSQTGSTHKITYRNCCQFDCLAAKGAIHIPLISSDSSRFHVVATHMQAYEIPLLCDGVRRTQVEALNSMVETLMESGKIPAGEPVVYVGDFNEEPSQEFAGALNASHVTCEGPCITHSIGQVDNFYIRDDARSDPLAARSKIVHAPGLANPSDHEPLMMVWS